jgi:predicted RNA binding protein YcfA (HicA-like mRNA interferase family)
LKRGITARQFTRAIRQDGFAESRTTGDHHVFTHPDGRVVPVAYARASQTFPIGTLRKW